MNIDEAKKECQRWLDYLAREERRSLELQKLATDRRSGKCDDKEKDRRLAAINRSPVVYDGARLADAVRTLMER